VEESERDLITSDVRVAGVFGYPVGHSLSPQMQNAALRAAGVPCVYLAFNVRPEALEAALRGAAVMGMAGMNLTVPHKVAAAAFMDRLSEEADRLGAVNTVVFEGDRLVGHNTDGVGFAKSVEEAGLGLGGCRAVVYGAGGAARAVVCAILQHGGSVTVVNRTAERAWDLVAYMRKRLDLVGGASAARSGSVEEAEALACADLVVNATSAGMIPKADTLPPVRLDLLREGMLAMDLVYRPRQTWFLAAAAKAGCQTINGVPMLVHQGAESFRLWFGIEPDVAAMKRAVLAALESEEGCAETNAPTVAGCRTV